MFRPRLVLGTAILLAVASVVVAAAKLHIQTDQLELISMNHPLIALTAKLEPFNFAGKTSFTVVVQAPEPKRGVAFLEELSAHLRADSAHFQALYYRVDPNQLTPWALLYLDTNTLVQIRGRIEHYADLLQGLARDPDLINFVRLINQQMASYIVGELFTGLLDEADAAKDAGSSGVHMDLAFLIQTLEGLSGFLAGSPHYTSPWSALFGNVSSNGDLEGYFWEGGKQYLLMIVLPHTSGDAFNNAQLALDRLRALMREVQTAFPEVQAGVTGQEALNNDELTTVRRDMTLATWIALLGVLILMIVFFRGLRRPMIAIIALLLGLCWTLGWTTLVIGHLNVLSVVFTPLLCGLGVDYGIHWFARLEEEEQGSGDQRSAIHRVTDRSGPGIVLAGLSAACSFFPFVLTGFRGLVELGLITSMGILLILVADFTVLPPLMVLWGGRPSKGAVPTVPAGTPGRPRDFLCLRPMRAWLILITAGVLGLVSVRSVGQVRFDLNPLRLQATNAEAVAWEKKLVEQAERSLLHAAVFAASPEEVRVKTAALKKLPVVAEVESIFTFLPERQEEKIPVLRSLLSALPDLRLPKDAGRSSMQDVQDLSDVMQRIRFKMRDGPAQRVGVEQAVLEQMERVRVLTERIAASLQDAPSVLEALAAYRRHFQSDLARSWSFLRQAASVPPMDVEHIPQLLRSQYYNNGQYLLRIYPKESFWEQENLHRFVQQLQRVDPHVVGDAVSLYVFAAAFRMACIKASIYAMSAIFILLVVHFRSLRMTVLAFIPLLLGSLWTIGIMEIAGVSFNVANSIFLPLILGAGVEYGVVILSRWREGSMLPGHLPLSTGKGVVLAALSTTVGFGTLMVSHHRGIFSLGFVAWSGSLCVLIAAVVLLPALLANMATPATTSLPPART